MKTLLRDLMLYQPWLNNSMDSDADLLNGEPSLKLEMDAQLNNQSMKMLGDWLDMPLFANKMVWSQLSNQKFFLTVLTLPKIAKELLKKYYQQSSSPSRRTMFYLKDVSLNQTWSPMDQNTQRRKRITQLKKLTEQSELYQEQSQQPQSVLQ